MNLLYEFGEACASSGPERLMDISGLSEEVDTFVFDCDGVIWYWSTERYQGYQTRRANFVVCAHLLVFPGKLMS